MNFVERVELMIILAHSRWIITYKQTSRWIAETSEITCPTSREDDTRAMIAMIDFRRPSSRQSLRHRDVSQRANEDKLRFLAQSRIIISNYRELTVAHTFSTLSRWPARSRTRCVCANCISRARWNISSPFPLLRRVTNDGNYIRGPFRESVRVCVCARARIYCGENDTKFAKYTIARDRIICRCIYWTKR